MTEPAGPIIEARAASFHYPGEEGDSSPALTGIDLTVWRGEYVVLIGPNGSGKTTLLKMFNALLLPTSGIVLVDGVNTAEDDAAATVRRTCGMVFQNPDNQLVAATVEEDIAFGLENRAIPPSELKVKVRAVSKALGLETLMKQPPHLLSGGEKQRVAIAGILAMEPLCMLMDEPTAMLDPGARASVIATVQRLNRDLKLGVVHVTHSPGEAAMADRIVVLDRGRVVSEGPPAMILSNLELLHRIGLQGTVASELAALLRGDGFVLPDRIIHSRELVDSLCLSEWKH